MYFFLYLPLHSSFAPSVSSHSCNYSCTLLCHLYIFILYFVPAISFIFSWTLYSCSPLSSISPCFLLLLSPPPFIFLATLLLFYLCPLSLLLSFLTLSYSLSRLVLYSYSSPFRKICLWSSLALPPSFSFPCSLLLVCPWSFITPILAPLPSAIDLHLHSVLATHVFIHIYLFSAPCSAPSVLYFSLYSTIPLPVFFCLSLKYSDLALLLSFITACPFFCYKSITFPFSLALSFSLLISLSLSLYLYIYLPIFLSISLSYS
jgi:hypothetical protein